MFATVIDHTTVTTSQQSLPHLHNGIITPPPRHFTVVINKYHCLLSEEEREVSEEREVERREGCLFFSSCLSPPSIILHNITSFFIQP